MAERGRLCLAVLVLSFLVLCAGLAIATRYPELKQCKHQCELQRQYDEDRKKCMGLCEKDYEEKKDRESEPKKEKKEKKGEFKVKVEAKQTIIASSTREAEFIACYEASNHGIWLRNFVTGLQIVDGIKRPLKIFCDNKSVVLYSNNNRSSTSRKNDLIAVRFTINAKGNIKYSLAGKNNVMNMMKSEAIELAFGVPAKEVKLVFENQEEEHLCLGPSQQQKEGRADA
ncbi:vicilin Jug r 6.0101-like [Hevea brasiliensis]|uniref:vicilin Jug r 6.0101-like n=1 Tax=Hevea brasiliensis TaxID=3981 RepID=UPI0025D2CDB0|nr:vicilin Jug r 6.0101-like [Hevea brasiliensis]